MRKTVKPLTRNRAQAKRTEIALRRLFRKAFASARAYAKKRLGESTLGKAEGVADWGFDWEEALGPGLFEAYEAMWLDGYQAAKRQLDGAGVYVSTDPRFINQRAADWAETQSAKLIRGVDDRTRNGVASLTAQARDAGWSNDRLADEIANAYAFSDERAELIAVTETARADVEANLAAYRDEGIAFKEWVLEADACESCQSNDVGPIPMADKFPSGVDGPPDHPNCRCDVVPAWVE